jgi:hypothetical protein
MSALNDSRHTELLTSATLTNDQLINLDRFVLWFKERVDIAVRHQNN